MTEFKIRIFQIANDDDEKKQDNWRYDFSEYSWRDSLLTIQCESRGISYL